MKWLFLKSVLRKNHNLSIYKHVQYEGNYKKILGTVYAGRIGPPSLD